MIRVRPTNKDVNVKDERGRDIPNAGKLVPESAFIQRIINDGDLEIVSEKPTTKREVK